MGSFIDMLATIPNLHIDDIQVLEQDISADFNVNIQDVRDTRSIIQKAFDQLDVKADFCLQPAHDRRKNLLICDMDSTLIGQECIDELADYAGVKDKVSSITERAMRGELDFEEALIERVGLLKDLPLSKLQECFDERIKLNPGADVLAATMKAHGASTVIVSGGFTFFTERIAALAGFDHNQANTLIDDGKNLTGDVGRPILGRDAKKSALDKFSADRGGSSNAIAIGDGANDLAMIQAAGLGVAYKAKPIVANAAHCAIQYTDLTTALYFQGYKKSDFVTPSR
ncbi:MAG: phosphoserine phosphatase SerB [Acidimicrobiales bacterium]|nr:phosphoserine phosphatase SerB [Hyphomonadaceae bacterium]RZV43420.1 MAG: phosphoserine phosphatase SerB [Acidimicrobiales bacterium]